MNEPAVTLQNLSKSYGPVPALRGLDLTVQAGEILAVLGPSGCGKTTLLRLIAGFERPDEGEIRLHGRPAANPEFSLAPEKRRIGMVFQDYALFPHLTVSENVSFGLHEKRTTERRERTAAALARVGLEAYGDRYPHELSGGERQRVALARALAPEPGLILLDEPFSNLDADRRGAMREDLRRILKEAGATAVFVTHDQEEALFLGDRLAVLNAGRLEQVDTPEGVFQRPRSRFVAEFMGQTDFLPGILTPRGVQTEIGLVPDCALAGACPPGCPVELAVRADDVSFTPDPAGRGRVARRLFKGAYNLYRLELPSGQRLHALCPHTLRVEEGCPVAVRIEPGHPLVGFEIRTGN